MSLLPASPHAKRLRDLGPIPVPRQGHPNGDLDGELGPGDSYVVPSGIDHAITVIEPGQVVDVFTPPREDYL